MHLNTIPKNNNKKTPEQFLFVYLATDNPSAICSYLQTVCVQAL